MFLGFVLATSSIRTNQKSSTTVAVLIPIITLGLPILDTLLAMSRRAVRGRPLFRADKEHIHHRLLGLGLTHRQAVLVLYGMCLVLGGVALVLTFTSSVVVTATMLVVLALSVFFFLRQLGYIRFEVNHLLSDQRRRNRALRAAVRPFADRLRRASGAEEIWEVVREASPVFDASAVRLELRGPSVSDNRSSVVFSSEPRNTSGDGSGEDSGLEETTPTTQFRARFGLVGIKREEGHLELGWFDARTQLDRDTEIAIELFCDYVVDAYERVRSRPSGVESRGHGPSASGGGFDLPRN
jgi:UDP-GlcNAc:undecaprenyl-phosphate GlcNAc-1-phosphate transferase